MEKMRFCQYVARRRQALGKSQKQLAEELSYTPQAISRFESLNSGFPLQFIPNLCSSLDCSILDLSSRNLSNPKYGAIEPTFLDHLHEKIAKAREKDGRTQKELSESINITERSLRKYEKGESLPSFQVLESIADYLNVPLDTFFKKDEPQAPLSTIPPESIESKKKINLRFAWVFGSLAFLLIAFSISIPVAINALNNNNRNAYVDAQIGETSTVEVSSSNKGDEPLEAPLRYSFSQNKNAFESINDQVLLTIDYDDSTAYGDVLNNGHPAKVEFSKEYETFVRLQYEIIDAHHISVTLKNSTRAIFLPLSIIIDEEYFDGIFHVRVPSSSPLKFSSSDETPFYNATIDSPLTGPLQKDSPAFLNLGYLGKDGETIVYDDQVSPSYSLDFCPKTSSGYSENKSTLIKKKAKSSSYFIFYSTGRSQIAFSYIGGLRNGVYLLCFSIPVIEDSGSGESFNYALEPIEVTIEGEETDDSQLNCIEIKGDFSEFSYDEEERTYELVDPDGVYHLNEDDYMGRLHVELHTFPPNPLELPNVHPNPFALTRIDANHFSISVNNAYSGEGGHIIIYFDYIEFDGFIVCFRNRNSKTAVRSCFDDKPGFSFVNAYLTCPSHPDLKARRGETIDIDLVLVYLDGDETKEINIRGEGGYITREASGLCSYPLMYRSNSPQLDGDYIGSIEHTFSSRVLASSPKKNITPFIALGCFLEDDYYLFYPRLITIEFID